MQQQKIWTAKISEKAKHIKKKYVIVYLFWKANEQRPHEV